MRSATLHASARAISAIRPVEPGCHQGQPSITRSDSGATKHSITDQGHGTTRLVGLGPESDIRVCPSRSGRAKARISHSTAFSSTSCIRCHRKVLHRTDAYTPTPCRVYVFTHAWCVTTSILIMLCAGTTCCSLPVLMLPLRKADGRCFDSLLSLYVTLRCSDHDHIRHEHNQSEGLSSSQKMCQIKSLMNLPVYADVLLLIRSR